MLDFWFRDTDSRLWFDSNDEFDERVRSGFIELHARIVASAAQNLAGVRALRAAIIVLDQFSRHMFRGTARAFTSDALARSLAEQLLANADESDLTLAERYFVYLPFEHSEDRAHQALAVHLIERLGNDSWTRYVRMHQAVIDRFGRFPHRNRILGRPSSDEERVFLSGPGDPAERESSSTPD